jgi:NADP-dependent 3-hydroxy acid dehydrogenase YdfG
MLASKGAGVLAVSRDADALRTLERTKVAGGGWLRACQLDVRERSALKAFADEAETEFGHIDILVNNAGWERQKPLESQTDADYDTTIETNFGAAAWLIQAVLSGMKARRRGWIVNVASTAGLRGYKGVALYSASKFAMIGLTESLEEEVQSAGVHVAAICPGWTNTELAQDAGLPDNRYLDEILRPDDVAEAILFAVTQPSRVAISRIVLRPLVERPHSGLVPLTDLPLSPKEET